MVHSVLILIGGIFDGLAFQGYWRNTDLRVSQLNFIDNSLLVTKSDCGRVEFTKIRVTDGILPLA